MTSVGTTDPHLLFHTRVTGTGLVPDIKQKAGCGRYVASAEGASLSVPSLSGAEIGFGGPATSVTTQVTRDGLAASRTWQVSRRVDYFVGTSAQLATLVVTFNRPGRYRICTG